MELKPIYNDNSTWGIEAQKIKDNFETVAEGVNANQVESDNKITQVKTELDAKIEADRKYIRAFFQHNPPLRWMMDSWERIDADVGTINLENVKPILEHLHQNKTYENTKLLFTPEALKTRTSGVNTYATKGYDLGAADGENQDLEQTTESEQPYVCGNIAPNERLGVKNPNGMRCRYSHPEVALFNADWSLTIVLNNNWVNDIGPYDRQGIMSGATGPYHSILYLNYSGLGIRFLSSDETEYVFGGKSEMHIGKNTIYTLSYSDKSLKLYVNKELIKSIPGDRCDVDFVRLFSERKLCASIYYYRIQQGAMTPEQVEAEHTFLRSLYPEIPNVKIGDQHWATSNFEAIATPMGNMMQEMQLGAAEELAVNTGNDDTTDWEDPNGDGTPSNVYYNSNGTALSEVKTGNGFNGNYLNVVKEGGSYLDVVLNLSEIVKGGKWYRVSMEYISETAVGVRLGTSNEILGYFGSSPTKTYGVKYFKAASGASYNRLTLGGNSLSEISIDNVSVKELGWADSTELYNYLTTEGGYSEQDALKECAWWCYYNNDPAVGAVYGKLYNWYAAKLLQNDIDAHNAANPENKWGWHVPTEAEFQTLVETLGGAAVAGGKMKVPDEKYWHASVIGNNQSGFSALGTGRRRGTGEFDYFRSNYSGYMYNGGRAYFYDTEIRTENTSDFGLGIRLIKDN